ncbi:MAG: methylated-DNA--[protein]-cysteine S-methyltransferase [Bacillota bacterium]
MNILDYDDVHKLEDYFLVEKAIKYIEANYKQQPRLEEIAQHLHLSQYHFQRVFTRWAGISPSKFLQYVTMSHAKKLLSESRSILDVSDQVGLSSTSRLYDLFVNFDAITPGEYKQSGEGLEIIYGFHPTLFGECLIAVTERGICALSFIGDQDKQEVLEDLKRQWDRSRLTHHQEKTQNIIQRIFHPEQNRNEKLKILLKGTNFRIKVWEALLNVAFGKLVSYKDIALMIGKPTASRAVGNAIGKNPIAYVIPCHRVIRDIGIIHNYRWSSTRKKIIIGWEASHVQDNRNNTNEEILG